MFHHRLNTANWKLLLTLTPVTSMSLRQFSAVSCVHRCPSTHQSHGKLDETHCVHELYVLQSKNVKFVVTKSGPDVIRTDSLAVKWSATTRYVITVETYRLQHKLLLKLTDFSTNYCWNLQTSAQITVETYRLQHKLLLKLTDLSTNYCWNLQTSAQITVETYRLQHKLLLKLTDFSTNYCWNLQTSAQITVETYRPQHKLLLKLTDFSTNYCWNLQTSA